MTEDVTGDIDSLYGLVIHHHFTENFKLKNEEEFSLFSEAINLTNHLIELSNHELNLQKNMVIKEEMQKYNSAVQKLHATLKTLLNHVMNRRNNFHYETKNDPNNNPSSECNEIIIVTGEREKEEDYISIEKFDFNYRGLLLTVIHTLHEGYPIFDVGGHSFLSKWTTSQSKVEKLLKKCNQKLKVLQVLVDASVILAQKNEKKEGVSPFCDDINVFDPEFEEMVKVNPKDFFEEIGTHFVKYLRLFFHLLVNSTAAHSTVSTFQGNQIAKDLLFAYYNAYYLLKSDMAAEKCSKFFNQVTVESGKDLWNIQDRGIVKMATYLTFPSIETSLTFEIPSFKNSRLSVIQQVEKRLDDKEEEIIIEKIFIRELVEPIKKRGADGEISMELFIKFSKELSKKLEKFDEPNISLHLISPTKTRVPVEEVKKEFGWFDSLKNLWKYTCTTVPTVNDNNGCLIMHIHGGGFVAMSPFSHECYLRRWSSDTGIPIISVNYRKAPNYKFPVALEECYESYKWILSNAHNILKQPLRKIFLAGDSAGGNLSLGVTMRAMYDGLRIPDALVLSYPATMITTSPSPARLLALVDPLVNFGFLKMVGKVGTYTTENDDNFNNPYISPAVAPNEVLSKFPPTYINMGALDPLLDDAVLFAKRLNKCNKKVKLEMYDGLGHGYLNLVDYVPESRFACKQISNWINMQKNQ